MAARLTTHFFSNLELIGMPPIRMQHITTRKLTHDQMAAAGVTADAISLYNDATESIRRSATMTAAVTELTRLMREKCGEAVELVGEQTIRKFAASYLDKVARDLQQHGEAVHECVDRQGMSGRFPSASGTVQTSCDSQRVVGRAARKPNHSRRNAATMQAGIDRARPSVFDARRVLDGRAIGDVAIGELDTMTMRSARDAALFKSIRDNISGYEGMDKGIKVRDVIGPQLMAKLIKDADDVHDAA